MFNNLKIPFYSFGLINFYINLKDFLFLLPEIQLIVFISFFLIIFSVCVNHTNKKYTLLLNSINYLSLSSFILIFLSLHYYLELNTYIYLFNSALYNGPFTIFFKKTILIFTFIIIYASKTFLEHHKITLCDYYVLFFCLTLGAFITISSNDFLTMYLGLEIQALSSYILACFNTKSFSAEVGIKYFLTGSFSSALIIFGISLITYTLGTQNFSLISNHIMILYILDIHFFFKFLLYVGLLCILFGLLIKLGVAPFHLWLADIYEGSLLPAAIYFATVQKLVIFILFIRIFLFTFLEVFYIIQPLLIIFSLISIIFGINLAFSELKIKRFLAYSSLNHIGFILLGASLGLNGIKISLSYFIIYMILTFGAWLSLIYKIPKKLNSQCNEATIYTIKDIKDLILITKNQPLFGLIININFLSMAGVPPLIGFSAKATIFTHILCEILSYNNSLTLNLKFCYLFLVFICIFSSILSTFYYLRLVKSNLVVMETNFRNYTPFTSYLSYIILFVFFMNIFGHLFIKDLIQLIEAISYSV